MEHFFVNRINVFALTPTEIYFDIWIVLIDPPMWYETVWIHLIHIASMLIML